MNKVIIRTHEDELKADCKAFAKCVNCARWTKPLKTSACYMSEEDSIVETLLFKENAFGGLYCDDFRLSM
jgi:hypothetical protein